MTPDVQNTHGGPGSYSEVAMQSMREKVAQLEADARRYRWAVKMNMLFSWKTPYSDGDFTTIRAIGSHNVIGLFDDVDAAIDAAIAKESNHG